MLNKHKVSKLNTVIGVALCAVVSVFALTKAPLSIAKSPFLTDEPISLEFQSIPLNKVVQLVANFNDIPIFNLDLIDDEIIAHVKLSNVPADQVFNKALKCGGLDFVEYESGIELRQVVQISNKPKKVCFLTEDTHALIEGDIVDYDKPFDLSAFNATNANITSF